MTSVPSHPALAKGGCLACFGHAEYSTTTGHLLLPFFLHGTLYIQRATKLTLYQLIETFSAVPYSVDCPQVPYILTLPGHCPFFLHCLFWFWVYNATWLIKHIFIFNLFVGVHVTHAHTRSHMHVEVRKQLLGIGSLILLWVLGIKLRLSVIIIIIIIIN